MKLINNKVTLLLVVLYFGISSHLLLFQSFSQSMKHRVKIKR